MKKTLLLFCLATSILLFMNCHSSKKAQAAKMENQKVTFQGNVKMLIDMKCTPCHTNEKGRLPFYDSYDVAKKDVDDMIKRVHLNPGDRGFMPAKNPKLSDSAIAVFEKWKTDGLMEK